ncbi:DUF4276 family protein [Stigmatella aurantiaca]|uniref:Conserved uncharacterized protein n=1 Tax=Stigmatella aurantiaca (strain DW4/3-1) TaxID=378806 RepID=E3FQ30_STIAD|nr:conserved uncharacterized protein [Stigmatella aurantiaca DW4/3-1]
MKLGLIVEGHGEVQAAPLLVRRLLREWAPALQPTLLPPHRVARGQPVKEEEFRRAIEFMARKVGEGGRILVLLDADDDLPCQLGPRLLECAKRHRPDRTISIVIAAREYEAWFLASAESLQGYRGLPAELSAPPAPETVRNAKGWLDKHMPDGYQETIDQPAFTNRFDMTAARRMDSFDKFVREVGHLFGIPVPPRPPSDRSRGVQRLSGQGPAGTPSPRPWPRRPGPREEYCSG